jgi:hypothetical protein
MKFNDVVIDIRQLIGLKLESIKKGANIFIEEVDYSSLKVKTEAGDVKSRSMQELEKIWKALNSNPVVHVDSVLGGSGSSRNQPETIFANLPYVEYLYVDGKKHLALVPASHKPGTIKQASNETFAGIKLRLSKLVQKGATSIIIVTDDLKAAAESMEDITGAKAIWEEDGLYLANNLNVRALIVSRNVLGPKVQPGTYAVIKGSVPKHGAVRHRLLETTYCLTNRLDLFVAMEVEPD